MKILSVPNYSFKVGIKNKNTQISVNNRTNFGNSNKEINYLQQKGFKLSTANSINEVLKKVSTENPFELLKKIVDIGRNPQDKKDHVRAYNAREIKHWLRFYSNKNLKEVNESINHMRNLQIYPD